MQQLSGRSGHHTSQRISRRTQLGMLGTSTVGVLVACAQGGSVPETRANPAKQPVTVIYYNSLVATHPETVARLANLTEFNATTGQELGITVDTSNATMGAGGDQRGGTDAVKIKSMVAAGQPPDMYYTSYSEITGYYTPGMTIDLEPELKGVKAWAAQKADMFPTYVDSSSWAGKLVGMPGYTNVTGFIWNRGLLRQASVPEPPWGWTWDDFKEKALRFAGRDGVIPLSLGWGSPGSGWGNWLGTAGTHQISDDRRRITFDTPQMLELMEFWLDLLKRRIIFPDPDPTKRNGLSEQYSKANNDTVFEHQGVYRLATLRQNKAPDFGVTHSPVHPTKKIMHTANGGHNMIVFKDIRPERRTAAARVALWMNAPYAQTQMVIKGTAIPVSKAVMNDPKLADFLKTDPELAAFMRLAPYGWRFPPLPSRTDLDDIMNKAVAAILYQEISPKAGLQKAQVESQAILDKDLALMK